MILRCRAKSFSKSAQSHTRKLALAEFLGFFDQFLHFANHALVARSNALNAAGSVVFYASLPNCQTRILHAVSGFGEVVIVWFCDQRPFQPIGVKHVGV